MLFPLQISFQLIQQNYLVLKEFRTMPFLHLNLFQMHFWIGHMLSILFYQNQSKLLICDILHSPNVIRKFELTPQ